MIGEEVIILADGQFPEHPVPLQLLRSGRSIICCDGAVMKLEVSGLVPDVVIGDLDSLTTALRDKYADRVIHNPDQETNDLTKAVNYCVSNGAKKAYILGATGLREDHTLGNISLLAYYTTKLSVEMCTDTGIFLPVLNASRLKSFKGQQISIFSLTPTVPLTLINLRYPLENRPLAAWWHGTLNEALGDWYGLEFKDGIFIVFGLHG